MRKVSRLLVVTVIVPFLVSCMATLQQPLPEPAARPDTGIRGLILGSAESAERIEYREMQFVEWTDSTVAIIGIVRGEGQNMTTRTYRLSDVEAILVHQLHPDRTSLLVAGVFVGVGALAAILFTGKTTDETVFRMTR
jgi:hypothetical protein